MSLVDTTPSAPPSDTSNCVISTTARMTVGPGGPRAISGVVTVQVEPIDVSADAPHWKFIGKERQQHEAIQGLAVIGRGDREAEMCERWRRGRARFLRDGHLLTTDGDFRRTCACTRVGPGNVLHHVGTV